MLQAGVTRAVKVSDKMSASDRPVLRSPGVRMLSARRGASAASGLENLSQWRHVWV